MKRLLFSIVLVFASLSSVFSNPITKDQALRIAQNFCSKDVKKFATPETNPAYEHFSKENPKISNLFVYNNNFNKGYVVVAADDAVANPIMGFCDNGHFDANNIPDGLQFMLDTYSKEMDYMRVHPELAAQSQGRAKAKSLQATVTVMVPPLLGDIDWGQDTPFNDFAPIKPATGKRATSGCVATAMGMVMYYNRWPIVGTGNHQYTWKNESFSADFSKSIYDWSIILPYYDYGYSSPESRANVALLLRDCGYSVDMQYWDSRDGSSGAYSEDICPALQAYFSYPDAQFLRRTLENNNAWDDILRKELDMRRPMIYMGSSSNGGHAFVCDGYASDDYFHFNWGWNGSANGYFKTTAMNAGGYSFDRDFSIVYNIKRPQGVVSVNGCYYQITGPSSVEFISNPDYSKQYSGSITIPDHVTIEGKTYRVTSIGTLAFMNNEAVTSIEIPASITNIVSNAFMGCSNLKTLRLNWTVPEDLIYLDFTQKIYEQLTLEIPKGTLSAYQSLIPWKYVSKIQEIGGQKVEYGPWESFESGKGSYVMQVLANKTVKNVKILTRKELNTNQQQIMLDAPYGDQGYSIILHYNPAQGTYSVPRQFVGRVIDFYGTPYPYVYVCDMNILNDGQKPMQCTYNAESKKFTLPLTYCLNNGEDKIMRCYTEEFYLEGSKQYRIKLFAGNFKRMTSGKATQIVGISADQDVAQIKYALISGKVDYQTAEQKARQIVTGEISGKVVTASNPVVTLPGPGRYTIVAATLDENGNYQNFGSLYVNYQNPNVTWSKFSTGTYTYSTYLATIRQEYGLGEVDNNVELYRCNEDPTMWKLTPFGKNETFVFEWDPVTNILLFDKQTTGYTQADYKEELFVQNYIAEIPGTCQSYFDKETNTLYFLSCQVFGDRYYYPRFETYHADALSSILKTMANQDSPNIPVYDIKGNSYGYKADTQYLPQGNIYIINGKKIKQ